MSSVFNLDEHFQVLTLTEKNKELQTLNKLLFNKISFLKKKIIQLENEYKNVEIDEFEIIDINEL